MTLDRTDTALLGAGAGALGSSMILSGDFAENVKNVFDGTKNFIDSITGSISDESTGAALEGLGIETFGALGTGGLSVLLTYLLSSNDEKVNAVIRSLFIGGTIATSLPVLSAAFIGFLGKKLYDLGGGDKK